MTTRRDQSDADTSLGGQNLRADSVPQNWEALGIWLRRRGMVLDADEPRQFANGLANLNYLISVDGKNVAAADNLYEAFVHTAGRQTVLKLSADPAGAVPTPPIRDSESIRKFAELTTTSPEERPETTSTKSPSAGPTFTARGT